MQFRLFLRLAALSLLPLFAGAQTCIPSVTVLNGLSINLRPTDTDGDQITDGIYAVLHLKDLIITSHNSCDSLPLQFGMRKSGTSQGWTSDSLLLFSQDEPGTQLVEVLVKNADGRTNYSETYIIVQQGLANSNPLPVDCQNDVITPAGFSVNGLSGSVRTFGDGKSGLTVPVSALVKASYDECGDPYQYRIRKSGTGAGVPSTESVTFDCNELGTQLVEVWTGDPAGNWDYSETYVIVQDYLDHNCDLLPSPSPAGCWPDQTPPELLAYNGFCQGLTWESTGPGVTVYAKDFIRFGRDKCNNILEARIRKSGNEFGPPDTKSVTFTCNELGTQLVEIWLRDGIGNWAWAETYVIVQDNYGTCGPQLPARAQVVIPEFKKEIIQRLTGKPAPERAATRAPLAAHTAVWPNPTADGFTLSAQLPQAGPVRVELYDSYGRMVQVLGDRSWEEAGAYQQYFSIGQFPSGTYRCVLRHAQGMETVAVVRQ